MNYHEKLGIIRNSNSGFRREFIESIDADTDKEILGNMHKFLEQKELASTLANPNLKMECSLNYEVLKDIANELELDITRLN